MDKFHRMTFTDRNTRITTREAPAMDIAQELGREHSKEMTLKIASWIGTDTARCETFMKLFLSGDPLITQRAAWVLGVVGDTHPALLQPYLKKMIAKMKEPGVHPAVKRNTVRVLQTIDIPRGLLGTVVSLCFDFLTSPRETIAVKVFSMSVIDRVARVEPDLEKELRLVLEQQLPLAGPGFRSRAGKILRKKRK